MYPLPQTPLPSVSGFVPRPSSTFKPIASGAPYKSHQELQLLHYMDHKTLDHHWGVPFHVDKEFQMVQPTQQVQHLKVRLNIFNNPHKPMHWHRMLHHCNLLHQYPSLISSHCCTPASHCYVNHNFPVLIMYHRNKISNSLHSPM